MAEFSSETVEARDIGMPFKELKKFRKKKSMKNSISSKIILNFFKT